MWHSLWVFIRRALFLVLTLGFLIAYGFWYESQKELQDQVKSLNLSVQEMSSKLDKLMLR